jgi:hypothetical protein
MPGVTFAARAALFVLDCGQSHRGCNDANIPGFISNNLKVLEQNPKVNYYRPFFPWT